MTGHKVDAVEVPGWKHVYSGKVRDLYIPEAAQDISDAPQLLMVASDRISAFDYVLDSEIPHKGAVLTGLSTWWFDQLKDIVGNHVITAEVPSAVAGRGLICEPLAMFPIECVARGYLTGSGLADYRKTGAVCGVELPDGLGESDRLDSPIYTPAAKAEVGEHDENISFEKSAEMIGDEDAEALRELTLTVYSRAEEIARERGIILADTKFEFGRNSEGDIVLGDEVLTPDSSRFWDAREYRPGQTQASFDKQLVRDWLTGPDSGWDKASGQQPPQLPPDIIEKTSARYVEAFERITGDSFPA